VVHCDAVIVGGGPAGSTCARVLHRAGWRVIVIDRARFPRDKVCAGWVTPGVFRLLELDPEDYRATGLTIQDIRGFRTSLLGAVPVDTRYPHVVSYAIRRFEFDHYLLKRSGACVHSGTALATLDRQGDRWVVNGNLSTPVVVGAGGHFCPVARRLHTCVGAGFSRPNKPDAARPVVAKEAEFRVGAGSNVDPDVPELFFCRDLEGYGWCVRKGEYLNIGIGRRESADFNVHVRDFIEFLRRHGKAVAARDVRWCGHAYLASGTGPRPLTTDGMLVVGDAAGLAYPESGEGIKPAVESGRVAAETLLAAGKPFDREALTPYESTMRRLYPSARRASGWLASAVTAIGRTLLTSRTFTRHVVIDRWFLRSS
jgi:geranylgeranyl reductase family protein